MRPALPLALLAFAAPAAAQPRVTLDDAPLDLVRFRPGVTLAALPPGAARCSPALPSGVRACLSDRPDARSQSYRIMVGPANGAPVGQVVSDYYAPRVVPAFDLAAFEDAGRIVHALVVRTEEDAARADASRWKLYVFDGTNAAPLRFVLAEHSGTATFPLRDGRRALRATFWEGDAALPGPHGLHLVGRAFWLDGDGLRPAGPVVRRLWTPAFAAARGEAIEQDRFLWDWEAAPDLFRSDADFNAVVLGRGRPGRLGPVTVRGDGAEQVAFTPHEGDTTLLVPVFHILAGPTPRRLPDGYVPRGGWAAYLAGRTLGLVHAVRAEWAETPDLLVLLR